MTSADKLQWPQGEPLFETSWRAVSEALAGNGIISQGDLEVTPTTNVRELEVATGSAWYDGAESTLSAAATVTLSAGDADNDRWDIVAFDTDVEAVVAREGTPDANPEPADLQANEILLAVVYTPAEFDDVYPSSAVHNWRTLHQTAKEVRLEDAADNYDATEVEAGFAEAVDKFLEVAGDQLEGTIDLSQLAGDGTEVPFNLGEDIGDFGTLVDLDVTDNSTEGDVHSYTLSVGGVPILTISAEADGTGGVQEWRVELEEETTLQFNNNVVAEGPSGRFNLEGNFVYFLGTKEDGGLNLTAQPEGDFNPETDNRTVMIVKREQVFLEHSPLRLVEGDNPVDIVRATARDPDQSTDTTVYNHEEDQIEADVQSEDVRASTTAVLPHLATDPSAPEDAQAWVRSDSGILKWHDGTVTKAVGRDH